MALHPYNKDTSDPKIIPINSKVDNPQLTIQNGTNAAITVTVSVDGVNYAAPLEGAITSLAANGMAILTNRYMSMTVTGTGAGTVYVLENG